MTDRFDVIVVGAGLMGAASAWAAAGRGLSVLVLDQYQPGHPHGSSHGSARIVRRGYGDGLYTQLGGRAFELWHEVEHASGSSLLRMHGGLDFGPRRNVPQVAQHLAANGVPHELLDAAEAERRWPGMRFTGPVVYHAQAGTMDADRCVEALLALARRGGADVRHGVRVTSVRPHADRAEITTDDGTHWTAPCVVLAAGAWLEPLVAGLVRLPPLTVTQQQVFHFPRLDVGAPPWPSVIHEDEHGYYHLAGGRDGGPGDDRKIGEHDAPAPTSAATRDGRIDPDGRQRVIDYVRRWLPGLDPTPRGEATCLYTRTPSEDFLLDRSGPLVICSPCSGHGAKFAPLIGEFVVGLVTVTGDVPDRFRLSAHDAPTGRAVSL